MRECWTERHIGVGSDNVPYPTNFLTAGIMLTIAVTYVLECTHGTWIKVWELKKKIPGCVSGFFIDIKSFRPNRNEYQENFLGGKCGRCVRLTTYHHPVPLSRNPGTLTLWNPLGLFRPVMGMLYLFSLLFWVRGRGVIRWWRNTRIFVHRSEFVWKTRI